MPADSWRFHLYIDGACHAVLVEALPYGSVTLWWRINVIAFNLNMAMKKLALQGSWVSKRMKAIRFHLVNLPGRIIDHARCLVIRIVKDHPSLGLLVEAQQRIPRLAPSG